MSYSATATETYSIADIEIVMRRVTTDLVMIASSTGAVSEETAKKWGHDVEMLAKYGYLKAVDITLLSAGIEQRAARFEVKTESGELVMSRPGGVLWPKVTQADLRIVLFHTDSYDESAKVKMADKLQISWSPTSIDTGHSSLASHNGRDYMSNGYGVQRKDFSK